MKIRFGLFGESAQIAVQSISANKMRSLLTLLGIIIGVASVILVGAGIQGGEQYVVDSVSSALGRDSFIINKVPRNLTREEAQLAFRRNPDIVVDDIAFLKEHCPDCGEISGQIGTTRPVYEGNKEVFGTNIRGTTANAIFLMTTDISAGRFYSDNDVRQSRFVCVIGQDLVKDLFPNVDPLGKELKISGHNLEVIGILEKQGSAFGQSLDNLMYLPISTFQKMFGSRTTIQIRGKAGSHERAEEAADQIRQGMRIRHRLKPNQEDDFGIITTEEINDSVSQFSGTFQLIVLPITLVSLVIGGIVVMNIMLVSVTERTFEIGLRKSLGARRTDILNQFLFEAFILAALGGLIGLGLAYLVSVVVEAASPIPMHIGWVYVVMSIAASGGIGIIFGIFPAYRASKLDPIIALTSER